MLAPVLYFPSAEYDEAGKERRGMKTRGKMGMPNIYKAALLSLAVWVLICISGALITAYLVIKEAVSLDNISYGVVFTLLVATFVSTTVLINQINKNLLVVTALSGGGALLLLVLLNFLFVDSGMANFWVTALVVFGGAAAAFLVQVKPKKRQTYKIKKR